MHSAQLDEEIASRALPRGPHLAVPSVSEQLLHSDAELFRAGAVTALAGVDEELVSTLLHFEARDGVRGGGRLGVLVSHVEA